jgi:hypothetical protein
MADAGYESRKLAGAKTASRVAAAHHQAPATRLQGFWCKFYGVYVFWLASTLCRFLSSQDRGPKTAGAAPPIGDGGELEPCVAC